MSASSSLKSLSNGQFELAVSAATGRIVHYGAVRGANVLWENPHADSAPSPFVGWHNWGGDKVWIWPEDDWAKWQAGVVAPPGDPPSAPYQVEVDKLKIRMVSPVVSAYGVRIVREIVLDDKGSRVTLINRLEKVAGANSGVGRSLPIGVWTVTQIPAARQILARLLPHVSPPRFEPFQKSPWKGVQVINDIALLTRPASPWVKIGLEADVLATPVHDWFFVIRTPAEKNVTDGHEPFRRAQVFSDPDESEFRPAKLPPYVEFEFTSPLKRLSIGESVSLTVTWELHPLPENGVGTAEIIAANPVKTEHI